jgi:GGDEF domain-containing protein
MPIVAMTALIIFISFTLNSLNKLRTSNENLKAISQCSTRIMTNGDFKVSLQNSIQTVERILPFIYCGIYLVRDNYDSLYPVCYKCNTLISLEDLKFLSIKDNSIYREIINGNTIYTESKYFTGIIPIINTLSKEIKYTAVIPIRTADFTTGFMLICFDRHLDINEELELLSTLGAHIGMINFYINTNIKDNIIGYKNYDGLTRYIDYNIKHKIFFTLAVIEIENYMDIIEKYNLDFYEAYKLELARIISKLLSSNDIMLCFEKEDIYVIFNLLDSKNAQSKLQQIASFLESYKFNDILLNTKISYAASEYPMDGVNGDEILANTYRKLHSNKNA